MDDAPVPTMTPDAAAQLRAARAERDAWAQELFESNRFLAQLLVARQSLADALATLEARVQDTAGREIAAARQERDRALAECRAALAERDAARAGQLDAETRLAQVTGSTSWRVTAPLRHALMALLGRPGDRT